MTLRYATSALGLLALLARASLGQAVPSATEIERALLANAARVSWPGFRPETIPLAIYDGRVTTLFRHPSPPTGFSPAADGGASAMAGRHPAVTANSSADIGGHKTATVIADARRRDAKAGELAAVALHESFHVFQRQRHPAWVGNEGDLLTYPVSEARRLGLRRLESDALRRAQESASTDGAACWARAFVALRRARYDGLDTTFVRYERLTELNEGLAQYIQELALGHTTVEFPAAEFDAAAVRQRTYTTGPALAFLLDRLDPGWKEALESNDQQSLDEMLDRALAGRAASPSGCQHTPAEAAQAQATAVADSEDITRARATRRAAFDTRPGWRLSVRAADGSPLWPQGFDPLNVEHVAGGLLHTRYLKLGNAAGSIEVIDEAGADIDALTIAAGVHPLFNGVRQVEIAGIGEPDVHENGDTLTITASGLKLSLRHAILRREGTLLTVTLVASK